MTCKHCGISESTLRWQAERIQELEAELGYAKDVSADSLEELHSARAALSLGLTPTEWALLSLLLTREYVSREVLFASSRIGRNWSGDTRDRSYVNTTIHHIRAKIAPLGLKIKLVWGRGYSIDRDARETTLKAIQAGVETPLTISS